MDGPGRGALTDRQVGEEYTKPAVKQLGLFERSLDVM